MKQISDDAIQDPKALKYMVDDLLKSQEAAKAGATQLAPKPNEDKFNISKLINKLTPMEFNEVQKWQTAYKLQQEDSEYMRKDLIKVYEQAKKDSPKSMQTKVCDKLIYSYHHICRLLLGYGKQKLTTYGLYNDVCLLAMNYLTECDKLNALNKNLELDRSYQSLLDLLAQLGEARQHNQVLVDAMRELMSSNLPYLQHKIITKALNELGISVNGEGKPHGKDDASRVQEVRKHTETK